LEAMVQRQPDSLPWAERVRFTENSVPMMIGDGLWGSIRGGAPTGLHVADPQTGNVGWFGVVYEHDAPAYLGLRLKVEDGTISEVESVVARARNPGPFGDPAEFQPDAAFTEVLADAQRTPRERMIALADGYGSTVQLNDGTLFTQIDARCERRENGEFVTRGEGASAVIAKDAAKIARGCLQQLKLGRYRPLEHVRARRFPIVDEGRGIVVALSFADFPAREMEYRTTDGRTRSLAARYPSARELF